ncbi:MAG: hypothetical protein PWQ91_1103 [Eubacteriales bacterium]|nr:hypothetical protein [Eubacteriales bacterium]
MKKFYSDRLWQHVLGVATTAEFLAERNGVARKKARLAALFHDMAKEREPGEIIRLAEAFGWEVTPEERENPTLLHGPAAVTLLREEFGIWDEEISQAVAYHTLGRPGMTTLEKIIYLADMIEPGRNYPGVEELRQLAAKDLDLALLRGFARTIEYVLALDLYLHPLTVTARNALLDEIRKKD